MNKQRFEQLSKEGYTRIPVAREVIADLDTPLSVYLKLASAPYSYLLESVTGGDRQGRYSIIGMPCEEVYSVRGKEFTHTVKGEVKEQWSSEDPLEDIQKLVNSFKVPRLENLPPFTGGLVGYFGYETIRYIEQKLADTQKPDQLDTADILLMLSENIAVFDNLAGKLYLVSHANPAETNALEKTEAKLDEYSNRLRDTVASYPRAHTPAVLVEEDFVSGFTREGFEKAVLKSKDYISAGDIMQVVLSQRMSVPYQGNSLDVYRALRSLNPSPYMYFMDLGETQVVGSSPEILVRKEGDEITVRPIAGTRHRGTSEEEDKALEADLLSDPKEIAEHVMLIDLGRNDVGRVARTGEVKLTDNMIIERYSHVMHIVSQVVGHIRDDVDAMDVLRAVFPAGTLSGAPKVRAMEIIDELEPIKRNVYAGAVGHLGWWGDMDTAIAIRTAVIKDGKLHVQVGAGIVHDSVPEKEWEETMNKGRALFRAVQQAARGL